MRVMPPRLPSAGQSRRYPWEHRSYVTILAACLRVVCVFVCPFLTDVVEDVPQKTKLFSSQTGSDEWEN